MKFSIELLKLWKQFLNLIEIIIFWLFLVIHTEIFWISPQFKLFTSCEVISKYHSIFISCFGSACILIIIILYTDFLNFQILYTTCIFHDLFHDLHTQCVYTKLNAILKFAL